MVAVVGQRRPLLLALAFVVATAGAGSPPGNRPRVRDITSALRNLVSQRRSGLDPGLSPEPADSNTEDTAEPADETVEEEPAAEDEEEPAGENEPTEEPAQEDGEEPAGEAGVEVEPADESVEEEPGAEGENEPAGENEEEAEPADEAVEEEPAAEDEEEPAGENEATEEPAQEDGEEPAQDELEAEPADETVEEEPEAEGEEEPVAEDESAEEPAQEDSEEPAQDEQEAEPADEAVEEEPEAEGEEEPAAEDDSAEEPAQEDSEEPAQDEQEAEPADVTVEEEPEAEGEEEPAAEDESAEEPAQENGEGTASENDTENPLDGGDREAQFAKEPASRGAVVASSEYVGYELGPALSRDVFDEAVTATQAGKGQSVTLKRLLWYEDASSAGDSGHARPMRASDLSNSIARRYAEAMSRECKNLQALHEQAGERQGVDAKPEAVHIPKCLEDMVSPYIAAVGDGRRLAGSELLYLVLEPIGDKSLDAWWRAESAAAATAAMRTKLRNDLRSVFSQVASALVFLNDEHAPVVWVHHDLKPANIMLDVTTSASAAKPVVKLFNFAQATASDQGGKSWSTRFIRPPALLTSDMMVGIESPAHAYDVFSFAASLVALLGGQHADPADTESLFVPFFMMAPQEISVYDLVEHGGLRALQESARCATDKLDALDLADDPAQDPPTWAEVVASCAEGENTQKILEEHFLDHLKADHSKIAKIVGCSRAGFTKDPLAKAVLAEWRATGFDELMARALSPDPSKRPTPKELVDSPWLKGGDAEAAAWALTALPDAACPDIGKVESQMLTPLTRYQNLLAGWSLVPIVLILVAAFHIRYTRKSCKCQFGSLDAGWIGAILACYMFGCGFLARMWLTDSDCIFDGFLVTGAVVLVASVGAVYRPIAWVLGLLVVLDVAVILEGVLVFRLWNLHKHLTIASSKQMQAAIVNEGFPHFTKLRSLLLFCEASCVFPLLPGLISLYGIRATHAAMKMKNRSMPQKQSHSGVELAEIGHTADEEAPQIRPREFSMSAEPTPEEAQKPLSAVAEPTKPGAPAQPSTFVKPPKPVPRGLPAPEEARGDGEEEEEEEGEASDGIQGFCDESERRRPSRERYYIGGDLPVEDESLRSRHRMFGSLPHADALARPGQMFGSLPILDEQQPVFAVFGHHETVLPRQEAPVATPPAERSVRFRLLEELPMSPVILAGGTFPFREPVEAQDVEEQGRSASPARHSDPEITQAG